jgi:hypothetical protein
MSEVKVGSEILAYCGQCKMDLWATIVAMVGKEVARVQCRTCKGTRAYKPPKSIKDPNTALQNKKSQNNKKEENQSVPVSIEWEKQMHEKVNAKKIPYSIKVKLNAGDVITHPSFGDGIVLKTIFPDKAEILFKDDIKTLLHSK